MGLRRRGDLQIGNFQFQLHAIERKQMAKIAVIDDGKGVKAINAGSYSFGFNI